MAKRDICIYNADATPLPQIQVSHATSPEDTYRLPTTTYLGNGKFISEVAGGGSPVANATAFELDTDTDYSNSGDRHIVLKNNGTEYGSIYDEPGATNQFTLAGKGTANSFICFRPENNSSYDFKFSQIFTVLTMTSAASGGLQFNANSSATGTAVIFNSSQTLTGSGVIARFRNNSTTKLDVTKDGALNSQSGLGLHGTTAPAQHSSTGNTSVTAAGSTNTVFRNTTFTGGSGTKAYTIGDIVLALKNCGLMAAS